MKPRILNVEPEGYSAEARRILVDFCELEEIAMSREQLLNCIHEYNGLIVRLGHKIDSEVLEKADKLKVIATATTGLNHIDSEGAARRNIKVLSLKGETTFLESVHATAEHTWALLLALVRRIPEAVNSVREGKWDRNSFKGSELNGKTLGIIGYGRLGRKVSCYGLAFGMKVLVNDPYVKQFDSTVLPVSLKELLLKSDIVSIHVPFNVETRGLIGEAEIALLKRRSILINTARGEIVDESVLLKALQNGHIAGAGLDVLCGESAFVRNCFENSHLSQYAKEHNNLVITPHIGGATVESMKKTEIFIASRLKDLWG